MLAQNPGIQQLSQAWTILVTPSQPVITCSKLTIAKLMMPCSGIFIVNFEYISHLVLVFLLLTLNM